jgi:hypothetical protein
MGHAPLHREASATPRMIEHLVPAFYVGGVSPLFAQALSSSGPSSCPYSANVRERLSKKG